MPQSLILYTNPNSRGRLVRWMLEEIGQPYDTVFVDYGPPMKTPDYSAINPMTKVPALRHGDAVVTEAAAICAYLADVFPEAGLAPPPDRRGDYYRWLFFGAGCVDPALTARAMGLEPPADKAPMVGFGSVDLVLDTLDGALQRQPFLAGETLTAADIYVGSQIGWGMSFFGTIQPRDSFQAYWQRLADRDAFKRATALDDAALPKDDHAVPQ